MLSPAPEQVTVTWQEAVGVSCPFCGAVPLFVCSDDGVPRKACHLDRHSHAVALGARPAYRGGQRIRYEDQKPFPDADLHPPVERKEHGPRTVTPGQ
jgi:hypothetical protein